MPSIKFKNGSEIRSSGKAIKVKGFSMDNMIRELTVDDIRKVIKKNEKGFRYFDKKQRVYYCDECDCCYDTKCNLKGKYHYKGDNKWHFWKGSPNIMAIEESVINDLRRIPCRA